jgi:hypothetical protein
MELNIIKDALRNNDYNINLDTRHSNQHKHNKDLDPLHQKTKNVSFVYSSKETNKITKLSEEIQKRHSEHETLYKHSEIPFSSSQIQKSGIYRMKCMDCPLKYVGKKGPNISHQV